MARPRPLIAALGAISMACSEGELAPPPLAISPATIDFGDVPIGARRALALTLANEGDAIVVLANIRLVSDTSELALGAPIPTSLGPKENLTLEVIYAPIDLGLDLGSIEVESGTAVHTIGVRGTGAPNGVRIGSNGGLCGDTSGSISFGTAPAGSTQTLMIAIANDGPDPVLVASVRLAPESSPDMAIDPVPLNRKLELHAQLDVLAHYTPSDRGRDTAELAVTLDAPEPLTLRVPMCGAGIAAAICARPVPVDFGRIALGEDRRASLHVESCGDVPLELARLAMSSDSEHPSDAAFALASAPAAPLMLEPGSAIELDVGFSALERGSKSAWIVVESNAFPQPIAYLPLTATALPACDFAFESASLLWRSGGRRDLTVANHGASICRSDRLEITAGRAHFALAEESVLVGPGETSSIAVEYFPSAGGQDVGTLELEKHGVVHRVDLYGNPPATGDCALEVVPTSLDFGLVSPGDTRVMSVELRSVDGGGCRLDRATLDASSDPAFSLSAIAAGAVTPNAPLSIDVAFTPATLGAASGVLHLETNDAEMPLFDVPLIAEATAPRVCVTPRAIDFQVEVISRSTTMGFTISACGAEVVNILSVDFTRVASEITIDNPPAPFTLTPGSSREVTVRYQPTDDVPDRAVIAVQSDSPVNPLIEVTIDGVGFHAATEAIYAGTETAFYTYVPATNALTLIAPFGVAVFFVVMEDIGLSPNGELFGVGLGGKVYRIDPVTGALFYVYHVLDTNHHERCVGLAFISDGRLVVGGERLVLRDGTNGALLTTLVPAGLFETSGDVIALPDGYLYWIVDRGADAIVRVDPLTGSTMLFPPIGPIDVLGLAYAEDQLLGFTAGGEAVVIDPTTGLAVASVLAPGEWHGAASPPVVW